MRCLLIDNYDSFTWNLADLVGRAFGQAPTVVRNDQFAWEDLRERGFDCVVISPGPGSVVHPADFHVSRQAIAESRLPVLGVCLGFQGIAHAAGARIVHAPEPRHGLAGPVRHHGRDLFAGLPSPLQAVRYHSLAVATPLPPALEATAFSEDGVLMALRHRHRPQWGVQFHPESVLSEHGLGLVANFRDLAHAERGRVAIAVSAPPPRPEQVAPPAARAAAVPPFGPAGRPASVAAAASTDGGPGSEPLRLLLRALPDGLDPEAVFTALYAAQEHAFWLDSQIADGQGPGYSFMGAVDADQVRTWRLAEDDAALSRGQALLAAMGRELAAVRIECGDDANACADLPFDFRGGWVGWFGYEAKALFDAERGGATAATPDALWLRVRRFLAFDHGRGRAWALALAEPGHERPAQAWLEATAAAAGRAPPPPPPAAPAPRRELEVRLDHDEAAYLDAIAQCRHAIVEGESYQVCLTNRFRFDADLDAYALYRRMRRGNAAPFGAYLRSGAQRVLSTSPERFLRVDRSGAIQAKPIKGTVRRAADPALDAQYAQWLADSPKDGAENLMIVDLMRNDLHRVAEPGSVSVPQLRAIESYRTVHQMVSTVQARLRADRGLIDLVRASFPGGSISGAPKRRTLAIIDRLERSARGVYCGSIGYLGYGRVADLNIGIRSLSYDGRTAVFGAGGAITWLSEPQAEFQEALLKAEAVLRPVWEFLAGEGAGFDYRLHGERLLLRAMDPA